MAGAAKIDREAIRLQWLAAGHTKHHAEGAARSAYVIGRTQHEGHWVPVLSTDLGDEHKSRTRPASQVRRAA